ncbi:MAG: tetratricopeptide repeat protein [Planctomycetota bacterium]|nr:tetratricopeptide repeat protein [Planctomycetota bacterium]
MSDHHDKTINEASRGKISSLGLPETEPKFDFGRYEEITPLAVGGSGQVLTAYDPDMKRTVAIKILRPDLKAGHYQLARFRQEAQITGGLDHPNIIPIHDMGTMPDGSSYFIMKHVSGKSLGEILEERLGTARQSSQLYDGTSFLRSYLKVCDAVAFAHAHGIVHRDLKPPNIMLGEFGEVLVMDWGIAKRMGQPDLDPTPAEDEKVSDSFDPLETQDGMILGTPSYMSPEQAQGRIDAINERSDIYCLGVILYQILTLERPFGGAERVQILGRITQGIFDPPRQRSPRAHVPRELEAVVLKAMALDPEDRYPSVPELQSDIEAYLAGQTLSAASYTPVQRLTKWLARNRAICLAVTLMMLFAGSLLGWQAWREQQERQSRIATRQQKLDHQFQAARTRALTLEVSDKILSKLTKMRPVIDKVSGLEFRELPQEKELRQRTLRAYLAAARHLEEALRLRPDNNTLRDKRREVGLSIGWIALGGRDYLLAREAFERLEEFGISRQDIETFLKQVESTEAELLAWRSRRLLFILDDLKQGLSRTNRPPGSPLLPDYCAEALAYRDLQTVEILDQTLLELANKLQQPGPRATWSQSERDQARFACRVLGRLGLPECIAPLGRWLNVLHDQELVVEAGEALCNTRRPEAQSLLVETRNRLGINSGAWQQIERRLSRIPQSSPQKELLTANDYHSQGLLHRSRKEFDQAILHYTKALELDPNHSGAYNNRAICHMQMGSFPQALSDYTLAIELRPNQSDTYSNRGSVYSYLNRLPEALRDFTKAIEINPAFGGAYNNRGIIYSKMKRYPEALSDFSRSLELDPKNVGAYNNRCLVLQNLRRFEEALEDCEKVLKIDPKNIIAYTNRTTINIQQGRYPKALADCSRTIELNPRYAKGYFLRGRIYKLLKRYPEALVNFSKVIEIEAKDPRGYYNRGRTYMTTQRYPDALADFSKVIELEPRNPSPYLLRSDANFFLKRYPEALADINRAIELAPKKPIHHATRGKILYRQGQIDAAIMSFKQVFELDPKNTENLNNRAGLLLLRKRLPETIADCNRILKIDPQHPSAYFIRGRAHQEQKNHAKAILDFGRTIEITPNDPRPFLYRGNSFTASNQHQKAIADYSQSILIDPRNFESYRNRGFSHFKMKQFRNAISDCSRAIELRPNLESAYLIRGIAHRSLREHDKAILDFKTHLKIHPESSQRKQIEAYLKSQSQ